MLGQMIARHFTKVFLSSVCLLVHSIFYLQRKKKLFPLASTQASTRSTICKRNRPVLTSFETGLSGAMDRLSRANLQNFGGYDSACSTGKVIGSWQRLLSPGKKTVAVKTAMKRLANRSDKRKKPRLAG